MDYEESDSISSSELNNRRRLVESVWKKAECSGAVDSQECIDAKTACGFFWDRADFDAAADRKLKGMLKLGVTDTDTLTANGGTNDKLGWVFGAHPEDSQEKVCSELNDMCFITPQDALDNDVGEYRN
jgi:hypothetical protein